MLAALKSIPPATTAANASLLNATASAVLLLTAEPLQLTPAAQTTALDVMATIINAAGPSVSQGAAQTITGVLDSVAAAATLQSAAASGNSSASASAAAAAVLVAIVDGTSALSGNLLAGLVARGGAGAGGGGGVLVSVSTPRIQLSVQVASPAALQSANMTAPGSASWFDPLPPAALGAAPAGAPVSAQFASFTFNPYLATATAQKSLSGRRRLGGDDAASSPVRALPTRAPPYVWAASILR